MTKVQPAKCEFCPNISFTLHVVYIDGEECLLCDDCIVEEPHKP